MVRESRKIKIDYPYSELYDSGYTYNNESGTVILYLKKINETCYEKFTPYARYLMSVKLGRFLETYERVYYIDRNKLNNNIDNLELKTDIKNKPKPCKSHYMEIKCTYCENLFMRKSQLVQKDHNFCSPDCKSKYDHRQAISNNRVRKPNNYNNNLFRNQYKLYHNIHSILIESPFKELYDAAYTSYDKDYGTVVHLKPKTGTTFNVSMNYYRYLLSIKLNRILGRNERIIYLDKDPSNKNLDNMTVKNHG
jgi:hypothetical protein